MPDFGLGRRNTTLRQVQDLRKTNRFEGIVILNTKVGQSIETKRPASTRRQIKGKHPTWPHSLTVALTKPFSGGAGENLLAASPPRHFMSLHLPAAAHRGHAICRRFTLIAIPLQATPLSIRTGKAYSISGTSRGLASLSFDALRSCDCLIDALCHRSAVWLLLLFR